MTVRELIGHLSAMPLDAPFAVCDGEEYLTTFGFSITIDGVVAIDLTGRGNELVYVDDIAVDSVPNLRIG